MKRLKLIPLALVLTFLFADAYAQDQKKFETHTFHHNDSTSLELDFFPTNDSGSRHPLVLFVHGGGFSGGNRENGHPFCSKLSDHGFNAATISYTLYMKGKNFSCGGIQSEKIKAIQLGAYHARLATAFFIQHADSLNIDTNKIFLAGASAGAEAVLQAAYWDTSAVNYFPDTLSGDFNYAGVISGAGAILNLNMINENSKIPTLLYHGTCDPLVPYHIAPHHYCDPIATGYMMFFGSLAIHEKLNVLGGSSHLMTYCGDGHKHAGTPFYGSEIQTVMTFINRSLNNEKFSIHRIINGTDNCKDGPEFEFCTF